MCPWHLVAQNLSSRVRVKCEESKKDGCHVEADTAVTYGLEKCVSPLL